MWKKMSSHDKQSCSTWENCLSCGVIHSVLMQKPMLSQFTKFCVEQKWIHKSGFYVFKCVWYAAPAKKSWHWWLSLPPTHSDMSPFLGLPPVGVFDMPHSNRYNILSISIFYRYQYCPKSLRHVTLSWVLPTPKTLSRSLHLVKIKSQIEV